VESNGLEVQLLLDGNGTNPQRRLVCFLTATVIGMGTDSDCYLVSKRDTTLL